MIRPLIPILLALSLGLQGCMISRATFNDPVHPTTLMGLEVGRSTAGEVMDALGAPTEVVQLGLRSAYRYDHTITKRTGLFLLLVGLFDSQTRADRIWLFFDEQGVLTHYGATYEAGTARYGMPWQKR